jgi:hypothetical protein
MQAQGIDIEKVREKGNLYWRKLASGDLSLNTGKKNSDAWEFSCTVPMRQLKCKQPSRNAPMEEEVIIIRADIH